MNARIIFTEMDTNDVQGHFNNLLQLQVISNSLGYRMIVSIIFKLKFLLITICPCDFTEKKEMRNIFLTFAFIRTICQCFQQHV